MDGRVRTPADLHAGDLRDDRHDRAGDHHHGRMEDRNGAADTVCRYLDPKEAPIGVERRGGRHLFQDGDPGREACGRGALHPVREAAGAEAYEPAGDAWALGVQWPALRG